MKPRKCKECGFILGTRPNLRERDGVCFACINTQKKEKIDFAKRQEWLNSYFDGNQSKGKYSCAIAVSGGKDSHMIVKRLYEDHNIRNILLITMDDEFSASKAGEYNRRNISNYFGLDHVTFKCNPKEFIHQAKTGFEESLNPLRWFEGLIYTATTEIARNFGINTIFFGENAAFEYGEVDELDIYHPNSSDELRMLYMGAIYPYSISNSLNIAKTVGFKDLDDYDDWYRTGSIESSTQIDSLGYMVHIWCKFPKFGFQRVSDIACRMVREGELTREQAEELIRDRDYVLDVAAKRDFCRTIGITEKHFDLIVDKHANYDLVRKDLNGIYRRKDFFAE